MRETLIEELRIMAKWYNVSYPASTKLLREAACNLEEAQRIMELSVGDTLSDIERKLLCVTWLKE